MQRIPRGFEKSYPPLVLWREDLEAISTLLANYGAKTEIQTDQHQFDSIDELAGHFGVTRPRELTIRCSNPNASLHLSSRVANLWILPATNGAVLYHELDEILSKQQRRPFLLYSARMVNIFTTTIFALIAAGFFIPSMSVAFAIPTFPISAWNVWVMYTHMARHCIISLERKSAARPFLQRNRDQLLMLLIGAILGATITFVFPRLAEYVWPKSSPPSDSSPPSKK